MTALTEKQWKSIAKGDRNSGKRIFETLALLEQDPRPPGIKALLPGFYRLRVGNYRIFYLVADDVNTVVVSGIERRNEATYKKMGTHKQQAEEAVRKIRRKSKK